MKKEILVLLILFISCNKSGIKTTDFFDNPAWVEELIAKNNCKEEYDYAKLLVNLSSYDETCVGVFCPPYNHDQKVTTERMNQFRVELDTSRTPGISTSSDTITFSFNLVNKNKCFCADGWVHYPGHITMIRGSKKLVWVNHGSADIRPEKEDIEMWFNDPKMLNYVKQNKDSLDPWFYNQLVERGYLK